MIYERVNDLIKCDKFMDALELLENHQNVSLLSIKYLSLLYRYYGQLEKEVELFAKYGHYYLDDEYILKRKKEISVNYTELLVPRKTLNENNKNNNLILNKVVNKGRLCFTVSSNNEYLSLLIECLHSILSCDDFQACPIYVVDCGLSAAKIVQLKKINERINVIEVDSVLLENKIKLQSEHRYLTSLIYRGFFDDLFSCHEYCFYIDSDAWIQDQSCLYDYIRLAEKQGIAISRHPFNVNVVKSSHWLKRNTLTSEQEKIVIGYPAVINCCNCVRIKSKEYKEYKDTLIENVVSMGAKWGIDQEVALYIAAKHKLKLLPNEYAYEGPVRLNIEADGSHVLYTNTDKLIKLFHLGGGLMFKNRKWNYFTDVDHVSNNEKKAKFRTSTHFFVPQWKNNDWITKELKRLC